ncbi:DUF1365 domain-containing protein [Actinomadura rubrisoli]|uniref:DUF1365 domain-containing protein n=1 Tax=Actinomadura rubrisoli TaxID=2530368 RepID=A0A4R5BDU4_9ACTN|nr:DUF1365 domain-containing protein [Actinomadura rubrisoli]TDD81752.1 DUF1365 domain-containing protein [Actinomadura rubrisoli]
MSTADPMMKPAPSAAVRTPVLFDCEVVHHRHEGVDHRFAYRLASWLVDLDDPPRPPWPLSVLLGFRSGDHLGDPDCSLRRNLDRYLALNGVDLHGGRIVMLAQSRALRYVFDPVTIFWCHDERGRLAAVVSEVRNTFGERHCYLLHPDDHGRAVMAKEFYVSPLFPVDGRYLVRFRLDQARLAVSFVLRRPAARPAAAEETGEREQTALTVTLRGTAVPTPAARWRLLLTHPLAAYRTIALIHFQAWRLRRRGLPIRRRRFHRPQPGVSPDNPPTRTGKR